MKIVQVVADIAAEASGPAYSVPRLSQSLAERGHAVTLSCLAIGQDVPGVKIDLHSAWPVARSFGISPSHTRALHAQGRVVDIIHSHNIWCMVNIAPGWVVPKGGARLVASPRGAMAPWAMQFRRWKKNLIWPLQKRLYTRAALLHATSRDEYEDIRRLGFRAPIAVIPNGIDVPTLSVGPRETGRRRLLFISRLHQKKGIEILLDAWRQVAGGFAEWELVIAGPGDEGYVRSLHNIVRRGNLPRVTFAGPVFGDEKSRLYAGSDLFVLPTHSENFGMVVAEALAHGVPAIVSHGAPWSELETRGCGYWVPISVDATRDALAIAMAKSPVERRAMGMRGRAWMIEDFSWEMVGQNMEAAYRFAIDGGDRPEWVWA